MKWKAPLLFLKNRRNLKLNNIPIRAVVISLVFQDLCSLLQEFALYYDIYCTFHTSFFVEYSSVRSWCSRSN